MNFVIVLALFSNLAVISMNSSCGLDNSPVTVVYEGTSDIEVYPWMGILFYPLNNKRFTTSVVLVTQQIVIGTAHEIDRLPKKHFRALTRVALGSRCKGPTLRVREYTYHPDYNTSTFSALAMVQLEVDHLKIELRPICAPPTHFVDPQFFAMSIVNDCKNPKIKLHRMQYVDMKRCKQFYRKTGLDVESIWPTHTTCARAISGGRCVWRGGTILAMKQDGRWRLLGFGVHGPGCGTPARFLDYGMYHTWIWRSVARIGLPAISKLGDTMLVMRRTMSNIQRFGPCDPEEFQDEIYTDKVDLRITKFDGYRLRYNITLVSNIEYSCIIMKITDRANASASYLPRINKPKIILRRWCSGPPAMCYGFQFLEIHFFAEVYMAVDTDFQVLVYGTEAKIIDPQLAMKYNNEKLGAYPILPKYNIIQLMLKSWKTRRNHFWFYPVDIYTTLQPPTNASSFISYSKNLLI